MTNSNKKTFAFTLTGAASLIISAVLAFAVLTIFSACSNSAGGSGGGVTHPTTTDKTYTVDGVRFTLKNIDAVSNKNIGHTDQGDNPLHPVSISAYYIGETEVTQELWQGFAAVVRPACGDSGLFYRSSRSEPLLFNIQ